MSYSDGLPATERQLWYIDQLCRVLGLQGDEKATLLYGITGGRIVQNPPLKRHDASRIIHRLKTMIEAREAA